MGWSPVTYARMHAPGLHPSTTAAKITHPEDPETPVDGGRGRHRRPSRIRARQWRRSGLAARFGPHRVRDLLGCGVGSVVVGGRPRQPALGRRAGPAVGGGPGRCHRPLHPVAVAAKPVRHPRAHRGRRTSTLPAARLQHHSRLVGSGFDPLAARVVPLPAWLGPGRAGRAPPPPPIGSPPLRLGHNRGRRASGVVEPGVALGHSGPIHPAWLSCRRGHTHRSGHHRYGVPMPPEKPHCLALFPEVGASGLCTGCAACIIACPHDVLSYDDTGGKYKPFHIDADGGAENCTHGIKGCTMCTRACPRFRLWEPEIETHLFGRERTDEEVEGISSDILLVRATDPALVSDLEGDGSTGKAVPAVATNRAEVLAAAGSRYTYSANPLAYPKAIEAGAERIALVGMGCQASAPAMMAARKAGKIARRLSLTVGLLCSKTFDDAIFPELFEAKYGI